MSYQADHLPTPWQVVAPDYPDERPDCYCVVTADYDPSRPFNDAIVGERFTREGAEMVVAAVNGNGACEHLDEPYRRLLAQLQAVREWARTTDQGMAAAQVQNLLDAAVRSGPGGVFSGPAGGGLPISSPGTPDSTPLRSRLQPTQGATR